MEFIVHGVNKNTGYEYAIVEINQYADLYELWERKKGYIDKWAMDAKGNLERMKDIYNNRINKQDKKDACYLDLLTLW